MKQLFWLAMLGVAALLRAADGPLDPVEKEVAGLIAGPHVSVVHFWAPWCSNCAAEMTPGGWAKFIRANPSVKFLFINVWHKGEDPGPRLASAELGQPPNLRLITHPNTSRLAADRVAVFLGLPLTWLPTTWIFRDGKLLVAFNYGEIRFPVLQQMIADAGEDW